MASHASSCGTAWWEATEQLLRRAGWAPASASWRRLLRGLRSSVGTWRRVAHGVSRRGKRRRMRKTIHKKVTRMESSGS